MENKIKKFCSIYYKDSDVTINGDLSFEIKQKKSGNVISNMKIINFIREDEFLKSLENLFLIKLTYGLLVFYNIYFTHKNIRAKITIDKSYNANLSISKDKLPDEDLAEEFIKENEKEIEEIEKTTREIFNHIKTNSTERLSFLVNKNQKGKKEDE